MLTFIRRNNIVEGPFIVSEIRERLAKGVITPATPARRDGTNEWNTIGNLFPAAAPPPSPTFAVRGALSERFSMFREGFCLFVRWARAS